jgi:hypothetical protein
MLVLQEFPDRDLALQQMRRVTRPGGVVAACQWDFLHMPVITSLVKSIAAVDAVAGERLGQRGMPVFGDEQELAECWSLAGLVEVAGGRLEVKRTFASFEALWHPLLAGSTPSTLTLASFDEDKRAAVRSGMMERLGIDDPQAPLELLSEAIVVKGRRAD